MANTPRTNFPIPNSKGFTETMQIADPGAGLDWIFTIPQISNEWRYQILLIWFQMVTDATVANRHVGLRYFQHGGAYNWWRLYCPRAQTASTTVQYVFALDFPCQPWWASGAAALPNGYLYLPLPNFEFTNMDRVATSTAFSGANDTITNTTIMIRRWIDQRD